MTKFKFCPKCGEKIVDSSWTFCPICGYALNDEIKSKNSEIEDILDYDWLNITEEDALTPEEEQAIRDEIQRELDRDNERTHFLDKIKPFLIEEFDDSYNDWKQKPSNQPQTVDVIESDIIDFSSIREASMDKPRFDEAERLYEVGSYQLATECYKKITQEHPSDLTAWWGLVKTEIAHSFSLSQSRGVGKSMYVCSSVFYKDESPFREKPLQVLLRLTNNMASNLPEVKAIKTLLDQEVARIREQVEIFLEALQEDRLKEEEQKSLFTQKFLKRTWMYVPNLYEDVDQVISESFDNAKKLEKHPCYTPYNLRQLFGRDYRIHQSFDTFSIQIHDGYPQIQPYGYDEIKETLDELMKTYEINNRCLVCGAKLKLFSGKCSKNEKHKATRWE